MMPPEEDEGAAGGIRNKVLFHTACCACLSQPTDLAFNLNFMLLRRVLSARFSLLSRKFVIPSLLGLLPLQALAELSLLGTTCISHPRQLLNPTSNRMTTSTKIDAEESDTSVWDGSDKEGFVSLSHPGYSLESDPETHTGGWLAHRQALQSGESKKQPHDWTREEIADYLTRYDYSTKPIGRNPRILILYGSLREQSFSRKLAYEFARLLEVLECDVRVYNPRGLPVRDPALEHNIKVQELRALTHWSDGHVWVSPEMHGAITGVFKNQIDWIPLNTGSVRPTQGKTCLVAQVNGGSQSFNAVNTLRLLARWMRMPCCTNQSSVAKAWQEFDDNGRMKESSFRDRVVDCSEEFAKFTAMMATNVAEELTDRYSERKEKQAEGRLLSQAEKEKRETVENSRQA